MMARPNVGIVTRRKEGIIVKTINRLAVIGAIIVIAVVLWAINLMNSDRGETPVNESMPAATVMVVDEPGVAISEV
ncbi:MAG: hypothetical protein L0H59_07705 [Tomitella sp.]|nr:hypothetical protein [Tomitella sp.]